MRQRPHLVARDPGPEQKVAGGVDDGVAVRSAEDAGAPGQVADL
jgi:hypothetical protein